MKPFILSETKRKLFSGISLLVIFTLFGAIFLDMADANALRGSRPFSGHNTSNINNNAPDMLAGESEKRKEAYPKATYSFNLLREQANKRGKAALKGDFSEYARISSFNFLLFYKMLSLSEGPLSEGLTANAIKDIWEEVSGGISYEDVDFRPFSDYRPTSLPSFLLLGKFFNHLYQNEIEPVYTDENNNVTTTYRYLYNIMPVALLLLVILFNYNNINGDRRSGVLKLLLTQSIARSKYYLSKWLAGVIHLVSVIFIPSIVIGLLLGIKNGFINLKYPITYLGGIFTRLKPIINYFDPSISPTGATIHDRAIGHIAVNGPMINAITYHPDVEIMPFYKYILIVIFLVILFAGFAVALTQLMSAIFNNEIISLVVNILVILLGVLISMPTTLGDRLNLSPFSMFNVLRIIEGTYNVTVLGGAIILTISTILLLIVGCMYFKRKPI